MKVAGSGAIRICPSSTEASGTSLHILACGCTAAATCICFKAGIPLYNYKSHGVKTFGEIRILYCRWPSSRVS